MATLTISFPLITPTPQAGYRVTYWPTDSPNSSVVIAPNPTTSPVIVNNLNATSYTGTVETSCGGGTYSTPVPFTATAVSNGAATLSIGTPCGAGYGNYNLTGTVGDVVRLKLDITGLLTPTSTSWLNAMMGSTNPSFSVYGTTGCYEPGFNAGISLSLYKNITIPVGGVVNINTSIFTNNSTSSMISASLNIMTVNGGNNTSTGNTQISGVCVDNSSTGGGCPGVSYVGD
jgi:hypothetical protein